jgi:hypothetical protein
MTRLILSVVAALATAAAQAQVYKCIDARGGIVYSQYPCSADSKPTAFGRKVPSEPDSAEPADEAKKDSVPKLTPEQAFRKRQQDRQNAEKEADQKLAAAKQKEENCRNAREQLAQYDLGGRISRIDAQGERYYPDEAQIEQTRANARAAVAQSCD